MYLLYNQNDLLSTVLHNKLEGNQVKHVTKKYYIYEQPNEYLSITCGLVFYGEQNEKSQ